MPFVETVFLFQGMKSVMTIILKMEMDAVPNARQNWGIIATQIQMILQSPRNVSMSRRSDLV
jgi:hypothetical protein